MKYLTCFVKRVLTCASMIFMVSCGGNNPTATSEPSWESVMQGHSFLTSAAFEQALPLFRSTIRNFNAGILGPLVLGNTDTDFQWKGMNQDYLGFYKVHAQDWAASCKVSELHFLRRECSPQKIEKAYDTCMHATGRINEALEFAAYWWRDGEKDKALRFLGLTSHIIQDSFSPAHTVRDPMDDYRTLLDVCTYRFEKQGVCFHQPILNEPRDYVSDKGVLRPQAIAAIAATRGYLEIVIPGFLANQSVSHSDIRTKVNEFLTTYNPVLPGSGSFRCDSLKGLQ